MARAISARALEVIRTGPRFTSLCNITLPGAEAPIGLSTSRGWSVSEVGPVAGTRLSISSIQFLRWTSDPNLRDLFGLIGYPGAKFDISVGINLGTSIEYIPVFHGLAAEGSSRRNSLGVTASLADPWTYYDRIPFTRPLATTTDTRAQLIGQVFTDIGLGVPVVVTGDGGVVSQEGVYTNARGQAAMQLATDGKLQAGFNAEGDLVIKNQPDLNGPLTPVWQFRAGGSLIPGLNVERPNIVAGTLERTRPWFDSLVNAVAVIPGGDWQPWSAQVARLTDATDPRHQDKVGLRGIEIVSHTIDNGCDALLLAKQELTRRLRATSERIKFQTTLNPAIECDDVISAAALPTVDDGGWSGTYITTSVTHSLAEGTTSIEAISSAGYSLGQ